MLKRPGLARETDRERTLVSTRARITDAGGPGATSKLEL